MATNIQTICFQDAVSRAKTTLELYEGRVKVDLVKRAFNARSVTVIKLADSVFELLEADKDGWSIQAFEPGKTYKVFLSEGEEVECF